MARGRGEPCAAADHCWGKGERPDRIAKTIAIRKETSDPYCADVIARIEIEDAIHELGNRHPDTARSLIAKAEEIVERALSGRADNESLGELKSRIAAIRQQYRW
jgi:hypothetical protein